MKNHIAFIATWLYSIPRIHSPVPRRRRPDRRWQMGMDPLNPYGLCWENRRQTHGIFPTWGRKHMKTSSSSVDFFGYVLKESYRMGGRNGRIYENAGRLFFGQGNVDSLWSDDEGSKHHEQYCNFRRTSPNP